MNLKTVKLLPIVNTYAENMSRVAELAMTPLQVSFWSAIHCRLGTMPSATWDWSGLIGLRDGPEFEQEYERRLAGFKSHWAALSVQHASSQALFVGNFFLELAMQMGKSDGDVVILRDQMRNGLQSILYAMVLNAYAAFEALASDMWIEVLNEHPKLASNFARDGEDKAVSLSKMQQYGFNLEKVMGTVLTDEKKVNFQSLKDIKNAYRTAFSSDVASVFEGNDNLTVAGKVRHLIAHRGGLVDEKFSREVKNFNALSNVVVGQYLELDGHLVCILVDALVKTACDLVVFTDGWMHTNCG